MTPEALRRRMAHGNIYKPARIDAALGNYFRLGNLGALRELALLWVADQVDDALEDYRLRHGITEPWELRERVIVAITGAPGTEHLIRRAARIAQRTKGELIGVHVTADSGLADDRGELVGAHRRLLEKLDGQFREVVATDVAIALIDVARAENATQIVLGASRRNRLQRLTQGSVISRVIAKAGPIDVHVISEQATEAERWALPLPRRVLTPLSPDAPGVGLGPRRRRSPRHDRVAGEPPRRDPPPHRPAPLPRLRDARRARRRGAARPRRGGRRVPAGRLLLHRAPLRPEHRPGRGRRLPARLPPRRRARRRARRPARPHPSAGRPQPRRSRSHGRAGRVAGRARGAPRAGRPPAHDLRHAQRRPLRPHRRRLGRRGQRGRAHPGVVPRTPTSIREHRPRPRPHPVRDGRCRPPTRVCSRRLASQLATAVEARRLQAEATGPSELAAANELRGALLQAVSHDLRTPLAGIKASISSLRQREIDLAARAGGRVPADHRGGDRPPRRPRSRTSST